MVSARGRAKTAKAALPAIEWKQLNLVPRSQSRR
jgi:hypothetical protein